MKTIVTQEWASQKELFEHLQYIELAQLGFETKHNLKKRLEHFFDNNPKAKQSEIFDFLQEFIDENS
jgi:hypothetical protein